MQYDSFFGDPKFNTDNFIPLQERQGLEKVA